MTKRLVLTVAGLAAYQQDKDFRERYAVCLNKLSKRYPGCREDLLNYLPLLRRTRVLDPGCLPRGNATRHGVRSWRPSGQYPLFALLNAIVWQWWHYTVMPNTPLALRPKRWVFAALLRLEAITENGGATHGSINKGFVCRSQRK